MSSNDLYGEIQQGTSAVVDLAGDEGKIRKFVPMKVPTFLTNFQEKMLSSWFLIFCLYHKIQRTIYSRMCSLILCVLTKLSTKQTLFLFR